MSTIRLLIADDDAHLRSSLRLLIDDAPDMAVVAEADDGEGAVRAVQRMNPDVVLLDVRMPRMSGLQVARVLAESQSDVRVILLTMFDQDGYVTEALRAGVSGFLLKNAPPTELLRAIRVVAGGNAMLAPEVTRRLIARFAPADSTVDRRLGWLTDRELETLTLIGRGASNGAIADELFVTATTVRTYVSRILTKIGARDRAQLVVFAYESGLVFPATE